MAYRKWNWENEDWPLLSYDQEALKSLEYRFMQANGIALGLSSMLKTMKKTNFLLKFLSLKP